MTADHLVQLAGYVIPAVTAITVAVINRRAKTQPSSDADVPNDE